MISLSKYKLRPHHSLCAQFFEGKGYSYEFTAAMTEIVSLLEKTDPILILTDSCDVICRDCPNNKCGKCLSENKVHKIDGGCLRECGLSFGDEIRWSSLKELAKEKIISKGKLSEICLDCRWECFKK